MEKPMQSTGCPARARRSASWTRPVAPILLLVLLLLARTCLAQQAPQLSQLDAYFQKALKDWDQPGMAIAIVKDGKPVLVKGYGLREIGKPEKVDENTLFNIASNTKAFTAAAVAMLVDEGKLKWDDHVVDYLPYFQLYDPYVTAETRIRDLLCHRVGLRTFSGDLLWYGTAYTPEEVLRRARYLKPTFPFRSGYGYSNLMFIAAGEVIAKVSGKSWPDFVKQRLLGELGMNRTVTSPKEAQASGNAATPHAVIKGKLQTVPWFKSEAMGAAGGICASASDMARWLALQLAHGNLNGKRLFSEAASLAMWTPQVSFPVSAAVQKQYPGQHFSGYGLGWSLKDYRGRLVVSHGGALDGMFSQVTLVPEENLGIAVLTNGATDIGAPLAYRAIDAFLGAPERDWSTESLQRFQQGQKREAERRTNNPKDRVPGTRPSLALGEYAGAYGGAMYGDATISLENGALVLRLLPDPDLVADLVHWHYDTFEIHWRKPSPWWDEGKAQFVLNANAKVLEVKLDVPNNDFWFDELEMKKLK